MSAYSERETRYDIASMKGYKDIQQVANKSPYPSVGNGKQFFDFSVGKETDRVSKVRVLIDFRGEYFSSFFLNPRLPISITSPIRNRLHFTAREAYEYVTQKANEINRNQLNDKL